MLRICTRQSTFKASSSSGWNHGGIIHKHRDACKGHWGNPTNCNYSKQTGVNVHSALASASASYTCRISTMAMSMSMSTPISRLVPTFTSHSKNCLLSAQLRSFNKYGSGGGTRSNNRWSRQLHTSASKSFSPASIRNSNMRSALFMLGVGGGGTALYLTEWTHLQQLLSQLGSFLHQRSHASTSSCESVAMEAVASIQNDELVDPPTFKQGVKRVLRVIRRLFKLLIVMSPIIALYPIAAMISAASASDDDDEKDAQIIVLSALEQAEIAMPTGFLGWYYRLGLKCVELSGAGMIKMMQWAGSRPDMFGNKFCAVFSKLQDDTTPHHWKHTEAALLEAFGENWEDHVELHDILGSGCIAQVYKGTVVDANGNPQEVAVKVMHPNVEDDIEADLDLMRLAARLIQRIPTKGFQDLKWLNLEGAVEELAGLLKIQLDLRTEAKNLVRFNQNFEGDEYVIFPQLVEGYEPTKSVLTETFCEGVPVLEFAKTNTTDPVLRSKMCKGAIQAVCKMIFLHNFTHSDLHNGNVLVNSDNKFVLLDVGMVTEHSPEDHALISDVLASFIRMDGRQAGRLAIADSNARLADCHDTALNEEKFIDKIENLTKRASGKDYFMEHLGVYISYICNTAAQHHVMMNQAFVSMCLAVKVQEGIALALDPSVEIWRIAIPIVLEGERRRGVVTKRAKEMLGFENLFRMFGWGEATTTKQEKEQRAS